ncbi:hypothetical protein GSI_14718 [Ganoderma sinense ZZ0214-1]|uniref:Uncharacterized protein n=1 Tax=Ganoderma sinense ZZ0214-1 TaxID=1077348 RepID=A0A2G8RPH8_9APHY|nr:hypothetical protein GSI_14718 [Ganoderma sinense ZZ0214-1]
MANLASTLEGIELWDIRFSEFSVAGPQFPTVHSLAAHISRGTPHLDALLHMFPSLSGTLSFPLFDLVPVGHSDLQVDDLREANKHAQEALGA